MLVDLNTAELKYYLFMISLDKCNDVWNTLSEIYRRNCIPNKTEDVNLNIFNLITRTNKSKN